MSVEHVCETQKKHLNRVPCLQAMLAEYNRFKMEDVPPRLETKQRLLKLFDEIQVSFNTAGHVCSYSEILSLYVYSEVNC